MSNCFNIIVLPNDMEQGMASSIRLKNMFHSFMAKYPTRIWNYIFIQNQEGLPSRVLKNNVYFTYNIKQPFTFLKFYKKIKENLTLHYMTDGENIVYIYHDVSAVIYPVVLIAKRIGYKIIVDITEDDSTLDQRNNLKQYFRKKTSTYFRRITYNKINCFIGISEYLVTKIKSECKNYAIPVIHIPITVNPADFPLQENRIFEKPVKIFYGGSFGKKDNLPSLLTAIKILINNGREIKLVISGKGNERDMSYFYHLVKKNKLDKHIDYLGYLTRSDYLDALKNSDICCMLREDTQYANAGFPFKLGEMMASGKPVVVSGILSIKKIIPDDVILYCDAGSSESIAEKICFIIDNPSYASKIAGKAREFALNNFSSEVENITKVIHLLNK